MWYAKIENDEVVKIKEFDAPELLLAILKRQDWSS